MGKHSAERVPTRELRSAYLGLRETYERLLRDHLELKNDYLGLLDIIPSGRPSQSTELELWQPPRHLADGDPMGVDDACALVRSTGLLTSPGLEA
jgi:hypothetical protein